MHIADGMMSAPLMLASNGIAAGLVAWGLRKLDDTLMPRAAMMTAMIFLVALLHFRIGPLALHLSLAGFAGILLGWAVVPVICVGLLMQALLFGFGGLTALGANTLSLALPAVLASGLYSAMVPRLSLGLAAGLAAALASLGASACVFTILVLSHTELVGFAGLWAALQLPNIILEAVLTGLLLVTLKRRAPQFFAAPVYGSPAPDPKPGAA